MEEKGNGNEFLSFTPSRKVVDINDNFCSKTKTRRRQGGVNKHVSRKYKKENEHISTFYLEHVMLMDSEQMNLISFFNFSILLIWRFFYFLYLPRIYIYI